MPPAAADTLASVLFNASQHCAHHRRILADSLSASIGTLKRGLASWVALTTPL